MSHRDTSNCPQPQPHTQVEFSSGQPQEGNPVTEFRRDPDRSLFRQFFNNVFEFPDGFEAEIWTFKDEGGELNFPAPLLRCREGEIVHVELKPGKGPHTIHHHGIEPDPRNDGVGHASFEVTGTYTYQFHMNPGPPGDSNNGSAGTYFYHCHVNTVLHVQMGMFGSLIIDPPAGRGLAFVDDPVGYDPRAEHLLVPYSIDPRWHTLNHAAGLDGEDVGLERFEPEHFYVLGGNLSVPRAPGVKTLDVAFATVPPDRPALVRMLNANYFPIVVEFEGGLRGEIIAHDGRPFRNTSVTPSPPVALLATRLAFGAAERYDVRLRPPDGAQPGDTFHMTVKWIHWVRGNVIAERTVEVRVIDLEGPPQGAEPGEGTGTSSGPSGSGGPGEGGLAGGEGGPGAPALPRRRRRRRRRRSRRRRRVRARRRRTRRRRRRRRDRR